MRAPGSMTSDQALASSSMRMATPTLVGTYKGLIMAEASTDGAKMNTMRESFTGVTDTARAPGSRATRLMSVSGRSLNGTAMGYLLRLTVIDMRASGRTTSNTASAKTTLLTEISTLATLSVGNTMAKDSITGLMEVIIPALS